MNEDTTVTLLDLLNLSLGTPEIGAVNFNLLHRFLLELVKHFSLARKQIDITDDISILSALEEAQMLSGMKSQTHFVQTPTYSNVSEHADGKRSFTPLESEKRGTGGELKSRDGANGKFGTPASGVRSKQSITEMVKPDDGNCQEKVVETVESKESIETQPRAGEVRGGQMMETSGNKGEIKSIDDNASEKDTSAEKRIKTPDAKEKKGAVFNPESPLSRKSPVMKSRTHSPPSGLHSVAGRSFSSITKGSKRTSPASSKADLRKHSFIEMAIPGLHQLERKISILEAKFESLSAAPTNLDIVQQARDLQSRESGTTAAGDMWQAMNLVRRIEVAEGAIDGITSMLDDVSEQLKKVKENSPDGRLNELSNKLQNVIETMANLGKPSTTGAVTSSDELQAKLAQIDAKLKNIVCKHDLKPYLTVKKMNDLMDCKLKNYKQLFPKVRKSPKEITSSELAQTETMETSSKPAQTSVSLETSSDEPAQPEATRESGREQASMGSTLPTSVEQTPIESTTAESEEAALEKTTITLISDKDILEQADNDENQHADVVSLEKASHTAEEREGENDQRRGSMTAEAFEELYSTMQDWYDFREEIALKIGDLEENISNNVDTNTLMSWKNDLNNLAEVQSTLKDSHQQVKDKLAEMQALLQHYFLKPEPVASQQDLSKLETSLEGRLQALSKGLQEMKKNFFQLYEMNEAIGSLKEAEDYIKSDIESVRKEIMKIVKQLDNEQEARDAFANAVGRKHSFGGVGDNEEFYQLRSNLLEMKNEIEKHGAAMAHIIDDQNKKQLHLETLYSHVDQLENQKADKQQINREIEVKADRKELEKKVSQDKFQGSLSCLDQSVQDLVEKLVGHESTLKQAINHITLDVNSKLDKMDMDTVKDYFEGKLKDLNSKVHRKPPEDKAQAAVSRCMLRQPANCLSCDRPVHLYREGTKLPSLPLNKPLPGSKTSRPYMTFDLGDLRQKMCDAHNPCGKDQTESLGQAKVESELLKLGAIKEGKDFPEISNRPCGGNHTLTCPDKRTTIRVNKAYREDLHFIAQLSQKDLSIVDILGYDGHVYKGHVNQLPSIPEIPKSTIERRPNSASGRPRTSSPI